MMEQVIVQASRISDVVMTSISDLASSAASQAGFAAAASVPAGDAAYLSGPAVEPTPSDEVFVTAARFESQISVPFDVGITVAANLMVSAAASAVYEASTEMGADAAQHYADLQVQTENPLYGVPGSLAALWTPDTAQETILVLGAASGLGRWSDRPFWQYFPSENPAYRSTWLTRGPGWEPPYATGPDAAANLSLPAYNPGTAVRAVQPPWYQFVRGPRVVEPQPSFGRGAVGGGREYRVIPFEN
jgi:hypothetical protein